MDRRLVGSLIVIASAAGFGSGALFAKIAYGSGGIGVETLMAWRFIFGAAATWAFVLASRRRRAGLRASSRRTVAVGLGLGVLYVVNSGTYYAGIEVVPASLAALIVYVYPAIVAVLTLRFGRRLEGRRAWGALALASAGCVLTVGGIRAGAVPPLGGLILVAISPVIYAVWIILQAWLTGERADRDASGADADPSVAAALVATAAAVAWSAIALAAGKPLLPAAVPAAAWPSMVGIGVFTTFIAIVGFTEGSRRIGAAQASLISTVEPVFTVTAAALLLGESLTAIQLLGGALIVAGVVVAQSRSLRAGTARAGGGELALEPALLRIADE